MPMSAYVKGCVKQPYLLSYFVGLIRTLYGHYVFVLLWTALAASAYQLSRNTTARIVKARGTQ